MADSQAKAWIGASDILIQLFDTKEIVANITYASDVNLNATFEELRITGGQSNSVLYKKFHSPVGSLECTLPLVDARILALKTGAEVKKGITRNTFKKAVKVNVTDATVTLPEYIGTPIAGSLHVIETNDSNDNLGIISLGTPATNVDEYSMAANVLTFNDDKKGKLVLIVCEYTTDANAESASFNYKGIPKTITITMEALSSMNSTNVETIKIYKAVPDPNFTLALTSNANSEVTFNCEVFEILDDEGKMNAVKIVNDEQKSNDLGY